MPRDRVESPCVSGIHRRAHAALAVGSRWSLCAVLLASVSCVSAIHEYPNTWPPLSKPSGPSCDGVAGSYADDDGASRTSLAKLLLNRDDDRWGGPYGRYYQAVTTLSLPQTDHLRFVVMRAGAELLAVTLSEPDRQVVCQAGTLLIRDTDLRNATYVGNRSDVISLYRTDEYLVVKAEARVVGLFFPGIPARVRSTQWYRFQRVSGGP